MLYDLTFIAPPRISLGQFTRALERAQSPALKEATELYQTCITFGVDPAVALAFFKHESSCGTAGVARETRNWGNIRRSQGRALRVANGWAYYASWKDSLADWCQLITSQYVQRWKLTSLRLALPRYAPTSDGNAPNKYIDAVLADVSAWIAADVDVPQPDPVELRTFHVRERLTDRVIVRAAATRDSAKVGSLAAGDPFEGYEVPGAEVSYPQLGTSRTWVRNAAGTKFVWRGLFDD
jgi:hypothetical protein